MIGQATVASSDLSPCIPESHPSDVSEYYRSVLRALHWPEPKEEGEPRDSKETFGPIRTLGVTSCARGEGVSTTAVQLAAAAAQMDEGHILLVDADLGALICTVCSMWTPLPGWPKPPRIRLLYEPIFSPPAANISIF